MKNTIIKILLSIVVGFTLLRVGFESKNDTTSIVIQSLGYISISYPFLLFFRFFIGKVIHDIKSMKKK
tara:strand:- start:598 stop:801 length:204 start_codon:yes stop_codon:yes gene_type:complete